MSMNDSLLADLECPVCTEYMHPPIRQCILGHNFCDRCSKQLRTCPQCRQAKSAARSYVLERLHSKLIFPCRNRERGCTYKDYGVNIKLHESECRYAEKKCPLSGLNRCHWTGESSSMLDHCREVHPLNTYTSPKQELTWTRFARPNVHNCLIYALFAVHSRIFQAAFRIDLSTGIVSWTVYLMQEDEASAYTSKYIFRFHFVNETGIKMTLEGRCREWRDESHTFAEEECVYTHLMTMKKFCWGLHLVFTVEIEEDVGNGK